MRTALFLCTGNYYRSRFAELLFNHLANRRGVAWRGDSRGLRVGGSNNVGPIDATALSRLQSMNVAVEQPVRYPLQVAETDLSQAAMIIALDRNEHEPYIQRLFPGWEEAPTYWDILDRQPTSAYDPLREIALRTEQLIVSLARRQEPV
jgi:protein-tyrosine phosphatase